MPINSALADTSNGLLLSTVIIYALAMLCYACDFAFAQAPRAGRRDRAGDVAVPELVGAGAGAAAGARRSAPPPRSGAASPAAVDGVDRPPAGVVAGSRRAAGRPASGCGWRSALTCIGVTVHVARSSRAASPSTGCRGATCTSSSRRSPAWRCSCSWPRRSGTGRTTWALFVLLPVVLGLGIDLTVLYTPAGSLVPALQSYWIAIHVTAMIVAIGLFIFGAVVTTLYLIADRSQRRVAAGQSSWSAGHLRHLPVPAVLDRLSYRSILFGFPVWTFGVMAGAIWADHAWGRYWGWDPKETWSFITWVVYAMFLHARATAGWRGRRAAWIQLAGFACLMFNVIGVNLFITGLHSYAGM